MEMTLGIMTLYRGPQHYIEERTYFRQLTVRGREMGMDVFVFTPADVNDRTKQVHSHYYDVKSKTWKRSWRSFPACVFDRCRYQPNSRFKQLQAFRAKYPKLHYLNKPLANKWRTHQILSQHSLIRTHLPASLLYKSYDDVFRMFKTNQVVYLKPINGTGGRGILRINKSGSSFRIQGRDHQRRIIGAQHTTKENLKKIIDKWSRRSPMLVQQGIDIVLNDGRVHDYRLLMQKNGNGAWEVTGCAGRIGANRSVTSNLHGGGKAVPMKDLMKLWFPDKSKALQIEKNMEQLGHRIVNEVESRLGKLCELALDIAVDRTGHAWLLEINPKPSREIFRKIGELDTYEKALRRPLEYALWIYKRST